MKPDLNNVVDLWDHEAGKLVYDIADSLPPRFRTLEILVFEVSRREISCVLEMYAVVVIHRLDGEGRLSDSGLGKHDFKKWARRCGYFDHFPSVYDPVFISDEC